MPEKHEIQIGSEIVTDRDDVYRKIVELLIATGKLEADTTVDDVLALKKTEFNAIIELVRELIRDNQIILPEEGNGPCGQPLNIAISTARRTRTLRENDRIDKVNLLKEYTLTQQYLDTLKEHERTKTITRLIPLFAGKRAEKSDEFVLQVAKMPIARYQLLGIEAIKVIRDQYALHEATILDEEKVKAITPYHLATMLEDTIRAIREHLTVERIQRLGGKNLRSLRYTNITIIANLSDDQFDALRPEDLTRMTTEQLAACKQLTHEQITAITSEVLANTNAGNIPGLAK